MTEAQSLRWWMRWPSKWNITQLRGKTLDYWHDFLPNNTSPSEEELAAWYIKSLLPEELQYATENHMLRTDLGCDTLVLLVGYSVEPLLQAISVYEPTNVILLLHKEYVGEDDTESGLDRGDKIAGWITQYLSPMLTKTPQIQVKVIAEDRHLADKPDYVFRALCEHALPYQRDQKDVVIDITGGKKSMDVGAFLFAAYAGIRVSYVDFDEYHPKERRPFGFTCRIGQLQNPYEAFRLRDWERVRQLYEQYHFGAAGEVLQKIIGNMHEPAFETQNILAAERLQDLLAFYKAWDEGDHHDAYDKLTAIRAWAPAFIAPSAVKELGPHWPDLQKVKNEREAFNRLVNTLEWPATPKQPKRKEFFESNDQLITYARDELSKIERLKEHNETRSALLRAAGLDELLIKARWIRLFCASLLRRQSVSGPIISEAELDVYEALLSHENARYMRKNLQTGGLDVITGGNKITIYRDKKVPVLDYEQGLTLTSTEVIHLRNQTIHQYVFIPQQIAEAAYELVKANLNDFIAHWATLNKQNVPPKGCSIQAEWEEVCKLCGLHFLPLIHKE